MSRPAIDVRHVTKTFRRYHAERPWTVQEVLAKGFWRLKPVDRRAALRDVTFSVERGRTVGIVGANGSGKSTLLRLTGGVGRPDSGSIQIHGRLNALLDLTAGLHGDLTGRENAIMSGVISGLSRQQVRARLDAIVAFAELEQFIDNPLRTYSTGMQMRLAFATAVHANPEILLIDEVLSVGDLAFQRKCVDRINDFKAAGCSILLVSHEASVIHDLCDDALWLNGGVVMEYGPAGPVVERYVAHMGGEPTVIEPVANAEIPTRQVPRSAVTTDQGTRIVIDANRFGSVELEVTTIRVTDADGHPADEVSSGQALRIEVGYFAARRVVASVVRVRILRADGLVCCDLTTEKSVLSVSALHGEGRLTLAIDRLDLSAGQYSVEVGWYAAQWAYAYDYRPTASMLVVRGEESTDAVLHVPHSWGLHDYGHEPGKPPAEPADQQGQTESITPASSR